MFWISGHTVFAVLLLGPMVLLVGSVSAILVHKKALGMTVSVGVGEQDKICPQEASSAGRVNPQFRQGWGPHIVRRRGHIPPYPQEDPSKRFQLSESMWCSVLKGGLNQGFSKCISSCSVGQGVPGEGGSWWYSRDNF